MSPADRTAGALTRGEERADRRSSIELLGRILEIDSDVPPAVILMSSKDVKARAPRYRSGLKGKVIALRFGFLKKNWIRRENGELVADGDAADVLMETWGSFEFGRTLETALQQWKSGAKAGLNELYKELRDLDVKDFAYLLRFRLYEEGEPFADYLEWLLGESLRAAVDNEVEWDSEEFDRLNERQLTEAIEGANPSPSSRIASLFHGIRFDARKCRVRRRVGLGDLFVEPDGTSVRLVITPDSDIIEREGTRRAPRLLTVGGTIRRLGDAKAVAGNLFFDGIPKSITWNVKDVMSHDFVEDKSKLQVNGTAYSYKATMRPLATQAIKQSALGRPGADRFGRPADCRCCGASKGVPQENGGKRRGGGRAFWSGRKRTHRSSCLGAGPIRRCVRCLAGGLLVP